MMGTLWFCTVTAILGLVVFFIALSSVHPQRDTAFVGLCIWAISCAPFVLRGHV